MRERIKRKPEFRKTIQWDSFRDGFPNLFIEDVKEMAGKDGNSLLANEKRILCLKFLTIRYKTRCHDK